jgi:hypothetical protein
VLGRREAPIRVRMLADPSPPGQGEEMSRSLFITIALG